MANKKSWQVTAPKKANSPVPSSTKSFLKEKADKLIDDVLKPTHVKPASTTDDFNYLADIHSKWYRNSFYFCATYNCPSSNAISPSFETKFARMEYIADNKFNLAYMRHTEQWFEVFQDISLEECLKLIEENPIFTP
ncbi:DUF3024 domain-containing protein [Methylobacter psychrophilus]|uniref:DUF3024 domain-containing protein n=1 Tax=Methylobacter psychrophilus TaxID=96941 RepID=UPI0021D4F561|nr:hypothetical protein [Methylobacter psychrophilus]